MSRAPMCEVEDGRLSEPQLILQVQAYLQHKSQCEPLAESLTAAWRQFYRDYSPLVRQIASQHLNNGADQDDCVQQVWLSLLELLPRIQFDADRGTFRGWLSTVARRLTLRFARLRRRQQAHIAVHVPAWEKTVTLRVDGPLENLQTREEIGLVHQVLLKLQKRLSLPTYRVFHLRWMEGQSFEEIGRQLDLSSSQVRWRHHRAKRKAAELMTRAEQSAGDRQPIAEADTRRQPPYLRTPSCPPMLPTGSLRATEARHEL